MALPQPTLAERAVTSLQKIHRQVADNIHKGSALGKRLAERGNIVMLDGGYQIRRPLEYALNSTAKAYSGWELLDITPTEIFTAALFDWKQYAVVVSMAGIDERNNRGSPRLINEVDGKVKNAVKSGKNMLATGIYDNGTLFSGKGVGGLKLIVADDQGGTVGGISRTDWAFWKNQMETNSDSVDPTKIVGYMKELWGRCIFGMGDHPDLITADNLMYSAYETSLMTIQRIMSDQKGGFGFEELVFRGPGGSATVVLDLFCPASHMYFLNTEYLFLEVHEAANWSVLERREPYNQDGFAIPIIWQGNLTTSGCRYHGVLIDT